MAARKPRTKPARTPAPALRRDHHSTLLCKLAAGLTHELNNLLLPIRVRLDALEQAGITVPALDHVNAVRKSVATLQRLSEGLHLLALDLRAVNPASPADDTTNLDHWWARVGPLLQRLIPRHVALEATFPADLPAVNIDPRRLTQAMLDLIVNAGEAIPIGRRGGCIQVWANTLDAGRTVELGVTDNGPSKPHALRRRALIPFPITHPRPSPSYSGRSDARNAAAPADEEMLTISSRGKGTTATFRLPATSPPPARSFVPTPATRSATVSARDPRIVALISHCLLNAGLTLNSTTDAPGCSDLWVTEPTATALAAAGRWRKGRPTRTVVLLRTPPKALRHAWAALGASIIHPPEAFDAIRNTLAQALAAATPKSPGS